MGEATDHRMTTLETTVLALAYDIQTVLGLLGQRAHLASNTDAHTGGVILHDGGDHVIADWGFPQDAHGRTEGHTVQCTSLELVLDCVRGVLTLHAPAHGWHVEPSTDPYTAEPVRVRWRTPTPTPTLETPP